jgi:hypothetical protein
MRRAIVRSQFERGALDLQSHDLAKRYHGRDCPASAPARQFRVGMADYDSAYA